MAKTHTTLLTAQQAQADKIASVDTEDKPLDELLGYEYLLTNTRGGYSAGTVVGCNTRRYHGLLIGALDPPANRIIGLSNLLETIITDGRMHHLSTFEFPEKFSPAGNSFIKRFTRDLGAHFDYQWDGVELTKSVYLSRNDDTVLVQYDFKSVESAFDFTLRPFAALRDFHCLQKSYAPMCSAQNNHGLLIYHDVSGSCELLIDCEKMVCEKDPQWWFNFVYRKDRGRGQDFLEDLWSPGFYKCNIKGPCKIVLKATVGIGCDAEQLGRTSIKDTVKELADVRKKITADIKSDDETLIKLAVAADQFICRRHTAQNQKDDTRATLLAGYPWFFDWGRDAFISLPGLLLATGRYNDVRSVLTTFAAVADEGMIPNRFDDRSDTAYFNSIDSSLWFINAAFQYLKIVKDTQGFDEKLLPVILQIAKSYHDGTRFGIHADSDGLITGGSEDTQLTWMDAKFNGIVFTPRYGKAVEVNALWYNALCYLSKYFAKTDSQNYDKFSALAETAGSSFTKVFWNEHTGYLNDCVYPGGKADISCRSNQILAVSLEHSPLNPQQQKQIVEVVQNELLTPYGLRTLSPKDANYKSRYIGPQYQRDESYHQGTVWAWLIGPFVEAYLKVNNFSPQSRQQCREFIEPLIRHLNEQACLGSISEIFDGDEPHEPRGCFAQAWSVAELIRAITLING